MRLGWPSTILLLILLFKSTWVIRSQLTRFFGIVKGTLRNRFFRLRIRLSNHLFNFRVRWPKPTKLFLLRIGWLRSRLPFWDFPALLPNPLRVPKLKIPPICLNHRNRPTSVKKKADKGKASLETSLKKGWVDKSMELQSLVSFVWSNSAIVTYGAPRMSDGHNSSPLEEMAPLHITPLCIQSQKQEEPATIRNETHGIPSPETKPPSPPTKPSNQ